MTNLTDSGAVNGGAADAVLDEALISKYQNLKKGLLSRLISVYLEEAPNYFSRIRVGVETDNFDEVYAGCHALKSCSGNLGAARLSVLCQELENAARDKDSGKVDQLFTELGPSAFEAEEALKEKRRAVESNDQPIAAEL